MAVASTEPSDKPLRAMVDEYQKVRDLARPDATHRSDPSPERGILVKRCLVLEKKLIETPAQTNPAIYAKLLAALPDQDARMRPGAALLRSAILDVFEIGV